MQVGILTARFDAKEWPLDRIITWAGENGIDCLEVAVGRHLDARELLDSGGQAALNARLKEAGVTISSLACYSTKINDPDPAVRDEQVKTLLATIDAAESLGVDVVCALAGMPLPGKSKMETIREDLPGVFAPVLEAAGERRIRIALENWFATNIQHLDHWRALFEVLPQEHFGLNFDPSHLLWQGIDYLAAVDEFAERIFHTHAKDTAIDDAALRRIGVLERGWWRYTIPGTGRVAWGEYLGKLREIGFDGAVSIEHEDGTLGAEEGFLMGALYLRGLMG
ncbi:MAG: sugar phosphate isomerase/epimerase family protein [Planctomycetota bacterium]|jgi:sugar phosphate isomerase/epimerase